MKNLGDKSFSALPGINVEGDVSPLTVVLLSLNSSGGRLNLMTKDWLFDFVPCKSLEGRKTKA